MSSTERVEYEGVFLTYASITSGATPASAILVTSAIHGSWAGLVEAVFAAGGGLFKGLMVWANRVDPAANAMNAAVADFASKVWEPPPDFLTKSFIATKAQLPLCT